jgi:hypothetical protein
MQLISDTKNAPILLPRTEATAVARPQEIALAITNRTVGPGARIIRKAVATYSQILVGINTRR